MKGRSPSPELGPEAEKSICSDSTTNSGTSDSEEESKERRPAKWIFGGHRESAVKSRREPSWRICSQLVEEVALM